MKICVLGATGLVGRETLALIDRAWPGATLFLYASRARTIEHAGRKLAVDVATSLEKPDAPRGDLAFVALDDDHSKRYCPRLIELGYRVIDKSNTYRMDPKVPLAVAGVNTTLVTDTVKLVANPNCTTIPFTLAVSPLLKQFGLETVSSSTYQAISGAGVATLETFLTDSQEGYAEPDTLGQRFDPKRYAGNTVPHNGKTDDSGYSSEERKLMFESRKILDLPDLKVSAQCCRVPVVVGHYENVWLTLGRTVDLEEIAALLDDEKRSPYVRFFPGAAGEGITSLACVHDRDRALVGRLRRDHRDETGRSFCLTVAADNLRLGAATNAIRAASKWFSSEDPDLQAP
jgi:aspartate-semialdehyde dehydrogenase